ncbi:TRAP transporter small permease [Bradyrhizobium sp. NP1]|uniref:TRAP transporter small permease n=1 Tax=Bradyrhizobium sp. NP1 TaxID=3049772 RepID=UPI0025A67BAD|nr:TRAP transporter small permease [Bradyrhizobium sp. NP1]WJR77298.1 TRAP transporter small permease [Bradyrhizobium sp. NP1]
MTRWLALVLQGIAALMLLAIVLIVLANVVARYFLHVGLGWTEEAARFLLIGMTFVAATVAVRQWGHFQLLVAAKWIPQRWQIAVQLFSIATVLAMSVVLVRYGIAIAQVSWFQTSPTMEWSMGYLYAIVPVSGALMFIFAAEHFLNTIRGRPLPLPGGHGAAPDTVHSRGDRSDEGVDRWR